MTIAGQGDPSSFEAWHGDVGCLLLHGFPGSPAEMRELGMYLAQRGVSVVAPCLPGFGQRPEALRGIQWEDWLRAAAADLRRLQERCTWVFAAGLSMGAALSLYLAAQVPIDGVAAISPPAKLRNPWAPLIPLARHLLRWHHLGVDRNLVDPAAVERQWYYTRVPAAATGEMYELLQAWWRAVPDLRVPVLLVQSRQDTTLRPEGALALLNRLGTIEKYLLWLKRSGHNVLVDVGREWVFGEVYRFIAEHAKDT